MMDDMDMHEGVPWMDYPLEFNTDAQYTCDLPHVWQCKWQQGHWRNWYTDDVTYAQSTVAFFTACIGLFVVGYFVNEMLPKRVADSRAMRHLKGLSRYLSYRNFRVPLLDWNSAPIGVLMLAAVGVIYFFCMTLVPQPYYWPNTAKVNYGDSPPLATRSGWLSIACMPFVFATAGKSNFITAVTGVSHEKLQVFHRWIAYAFFITALLHTFPFVVYHIKVGDIVEEWNTSVFYWTGTVALLAQGWLTFASFGPIRNFCYEWFKFSHFVAALVFVLFFFFHCDHTLSSWDYFVVTGVLFSLSWLHRQIRVYFEHGIGHRATLNLESNGFIRVTVPTKASWHAGQHFFVRFMSLGFHAWTIHPFTACSLPERARAFEKGHSELLFYIRPRGGFTARLARYIESHPNIKMRVLLDGPYGGVDMQKIMSSERMIVVAGGSGAGWLLPMISAWIRKTELPEALDVDYQKPSLRVILATRDMATRHWFQEALFTMLPASQTFPGLDVEIYYTGTSENRRAPRITGQFLSQLEESEKAEESKLSTAGVISESETCSELTSSISGKFQHLDCRPDLPAIISPEVVSKGGNESLGVFVCGPLSMQSDVSNAVAREQLEIAKTGSRDIYLHMEHFSWA